MKRKGLKSAMSILVGYLLLAFAFLTAIGSLISTICLLLGVILVPFGFILLIMYIREK